MPGLVQIPDGKALFYFEIALPKTLHLKLREEVKEAAEELVERLVPDEVRNPWARGKKYGGSHKPEDVREFVEARCKEVKKRGLQIQTTGIADDFYCWTGNQRICYHAFTVWQGGVKKQVSITSYGMEFVTDLLLMMAYPTDLKESKKKPTSIRQRKKTRKKTAKKSKSKSTSKK